MGESGHAVRGGGGDDKRVGVDAYLNRYGNVDRDRGWRDAYFHCNRSSDRDYNGDK